MAVAEDIGYKGGLGIKQEVLLVALIMLVGAMLRLFAFTEISNGTLRFVGTCGQLFDEARPLFDARNPLHFEVFFYPPVAPMIVASTGLLLQAVWPEVLDFARYCLLFNVGVSIATLLIVYLVGREWSVPVGLAAMSFYAVTMIAIYSSDNVQMYPTFFSMLALYFFFRSVRKQSVINLTSMGVFLGLGVASKYFPIMFALMLFMVYFLQHAWQGRGVHMERSSGRRHQRLEFAWNCLLYAILIGTIAICYAAVFHRDVVLAGFKFLYDGHPHEHPFEYHLSTLNRFYNISTLGVGLLAGLVATGIYIPHRQGISAWEWFQRFSRRNWLWLTPLASMVLTLVMAIGIPAALNLNNYLKYTTWIAKGYGSADGGFFPAGNPAPSYLFSYFPESVGIPLFVLSCLGIGYCLFARDKKAILLLIIALPLYITLELSSVKVNRFAMDLMPLLCLFSAIVIVQFSKRSHAAIIRTISVLIFIGVFLYSALYSLAWASLQSSLRSVPSQTAEWINRHIAPGSQLGMKANLWLAGSPGLLPDPATLTKFRITEYTEYPDFIILPKTLYEIMRQYADLTRSGYIYRPEDWSPFPPPMSDEVAILVDVIDEQQYELVKEFERKPSVFGITFPPQSLSGRTWLLEHTGPYGMRFYKKRVSQNGATLCRVRSQS